MYLEMTSTQQAIIEGMSVERIWVTKEGELRRTHIPNIYQMGETMLTEQYFIRYAKEKAAEKVLSRFKLNSSYFMYRNKNGAWRNY